MAIDIEHAWIADGSTGADEPYLCECCETESYNDFFLTTVWGNYTEVCDNCLSLYYFVCKECKQYHEIQYACDGDLCEQCYSERDAEE